jgi:phosphoenolpyruvate carboxykinase (GTP)
MAHREEHLAQFADLPEAIWEAHRRVAAELDAQATAVVDGQTQAIRR